MCGAMGEDTIPKSATVSDFVTLLDCYGEQLLGV